MSSFNVPEPEIPDYYADLGISQQASLQDVKTAFRQLARKHHPDKKAPGQSIDAHEFRKVREAYEHLTDKDERQRYDAYYFDLKERWERYRAWKDTEIKYEEARRAEEERRAARARAEEERRRAETERIRKMAEAMRATMERERLERIRKERARQAEERSREAARKAREQQEQAARERIRIQKEKEAERRSEEAARRARAEREQAAQERLRTILIEEKQEASRRTWAKMREDADRREAMKRQEAWPKQPSNPPGQRRASTARYTWRERVPSKGQQSGTTPTQAQAEKTTRSMPSTTAYTKVNPRPTWREREAAKAAAEKGQEEGPTRTVPLQFSWGAPPKYSWREREAARNTSKVA
ncbi:DnaJ-domain-containing protein [Daldinia sp. FL1419]|nr:DnaJ-domain-containing protein [Daldinia sp. FL1419]